MEGHPEDSLLVAIMTLGSSIEAITAEISAMEERRSSLQSSMRDQAAAIFSLLPIVKLPEDEDRRLRALAMAQLAVQQPEARVRHGSVTRAVLAMLRKSQDGVNVRDLIDEIERGNFSVKNPETAVRSALKNLRGRGEVEFVISSGLYRLTRPR